MFVADEGLKVFFKNVKFGRRKGQGMDEAHLKNEAIMLRNFSTLIAELLTGDGAFFNFDILPIESEFKSIL